MQELPPQKFGTLSVHRVRHTLTYDFKSRQYLGFWNHEASLKVAYFVNRRMRRRWRRCYKRFRYSKYPFTECVTTNTYWVKPLPHPKGEALEPYTRESPKEDLNPDQTFKLPPVKGEFKWTKGKDGLSLEKVS